MSDTSNTEQYELARRARQGDPEALGLLIKQNRERLFALAYAELRHHADAQDAVASALLNICIHIRHLRQPERMHAWMNSIVRNEAHRLRRGPEAPLRLDDFPHESLTSDTLQAVLRDADIMQALHQLSPNQAQAIRLFYFQQLSIREIAQRMDRSEGTVKSWLHFGRQRLANAMKENPMTNTLALPTAIELPVAELLKMYTTQFDQDPLMANRGLLTQTQESLKAALRRLPLSSELAHLAVRMNWDWLADASFLTPVLADYLQQPLPAEEEAWARCEYVRGLGALGRSEEVVEQQRASLIWARERWEAAQLTSQQLLRVWSNGSQAQHWGMLGRREEWLALLHDLLATIPPDTDNRMERFYALRAACLLQEGDKPEEALAVTEQIRALAAEDVHWERATEMEVQADTAAMRIYAAQGNTESLLATATRAIASLEQQWQGSANITGEARTRLLLQYDNVACPLFHARQYALSIPLHRRCLELGYNREFAYLWLAAALWAHSGERAEALELLRQGRARRSTASYQEDFAELPEFQNVLEAPDFLAAVTGHSP